MKAAECVEKLVKSYHKHISSQPVNDLIHIEPEDFTEGVTDRWLRLNDEALEGTPRDFLDNLPLPESPEETYEIIKIIATNLIINIPDFLLSYLGKSEFTCSVIREILIKDVAVTDMNSNISDDVEILQQATLIAGLYEELIPDLIEVYKKSNGANELLLENVADSLGRLEGFDECADFLNTEKIGYKHLSLISVMGANGYRSDKVFQCLKNCFKSVEDDTIRMTIAYALDDYGDSRAVPVLRRYALKMREKLEGSRDNDIMNNLYILTHLIQSLGGNIEDIQIF